MKLKTAIKNAQDWAHQDSIGITLYHNSKVGEYSYSDQTSLESKYPHLKVAGRVTARGIWLPVDEETTTMNSLESARLLLVKELLGQEDPSKHDITEAWTLLLVIRRTTMYPNLDRAIQLLEGDEYSITPPSATNSLAVLNDVDREDSAGRDEQETSCYHDDIGELSPATFKIEVHTVSCAEGRFTTNGVEHDTLDLAVEAAKDLMLRWMAVTEWRVIDSNEKVVATS